SGAAGIEGGQTRRGLIRLVGHVDANLGAVGDGRVEGIEIVHVLAAKGCGLVAGTQRQLVDGRAEYLGLFCKRHSGLLPSMILVYMNILMKNKNKTGGIGGAPRPVIQV